MAKRQKIPMTKKGNVREGGGSLDQTQRRAMQADRAMGKKPLQVSISSPPLQRNSVCVICRTTAGPCRAAAD